VIQFRHSPPQVDEQRPLIDQWRGIEDEAIAYLRAEQPPDSVFCGWLEAFHQHLARREQQLLLMELEKHEATVRHYCDGGRPADQEMLRELRQFGEKLFASTLE
jgi:hypothetical protein